MLKALGLEEAELLRARKGDWRKRLIGQRVRQETSVSLRWLAARLRMGSEGHVSRITGDWQISPIIRDGDLLRERFRVMQEKGLTPNLDLFLWLRAGVLPSGRRQGLRLLDKMIARTPATRPKRPANPSA